MGGGVIVLTASELEDGLRGDALCTQGTGGVGWVAVMGLGMRERGKERGEGGRGEGEREMERGT